MKTPVLETDRLRLRPFRREDARAVFDGWEQDPDVARYMFWTSHHDIRKTEAWLDFELGFRFEKEIPYFCNDGTVLRQGVLCRLTLNETET